jgi:hypothetical protein
MTPHSRTHCHDSNRQRRASAPARPERATRRHAATAALLPLALLALGVPRAASAYDDGRAGFALRVKGLLSPYEVMSVTALPRETLEIEPFGGAGAAGLELKAECGELQRKKGARWSYRAPATEGRCTIEARDVATSDTTRLNVFVLVPYDQVVRGRLKGYRIGDYPARPPGGNPAYVRPRGFVEVTKADEDTRLTPHFKLKHFVSKQGDRFPKFLIFDERLLLKLEAILERLNRQGIEADTLHVMSGYRTPFYNKAIGNVAFSMHQFGGAADVFVDEDGDQRMDDINGDERVDVADAQHLYQIIDALETGLPWVGGLGPYPATPAHGPFVHVDVRGRRARWGELPPKVASAAVRSEKTPAAAPPAKAAPKKAAAASRAAARRAVR